MYFKKLFQIVIYFKSPCDSGISLWHYDTNIIRKFYTSLFFYFISGFALIEKLFHINKQIIFNTLNIDPQISCAHCTDQQRKIFNSNTPPVKNLVIVTIELQ